MFVLSCNNSSQKYVVNKENLPDSTNVVIVWDSSYTLNSSSAFIYHNEINVTLSDFDNLFGSLGFEIKNEGNQWKALLSQPSPTDCLYVSSQFHILNQFISLNKLHFESGDKLRGYINLLTLGKKGFLREPGIPFIDARKWDTVKIKGVFSTTIN